MEGRREHRIIKNQTGLESINNQEKSIGNKMRARGLKSKFLSYAATSTHTEVETCQLATTAKRDGGLLIAFM
jgi:hypothetical protein